MAGSGRDWVEWHRQYDDPESSLNARVAHVRRYVADAVDRLPSDQPVRILSLCAGDGRDVIGALADHPRRGDVSARLVELDPRLADRARASAAAAGVADVVEVVEGDTGTTEAAAGIAPVDVLLLCGIFGNVPVEDVARTVRAASSLCRPGATVVWTRHRREPDLTPHIRRWFTDAGWEEVGFEDDMSAVGAARLVTAPPAFEPGRRLFRFARAHPLVVDDALLRRVSAVTERFMLRRLQLFTGPPVDLTEFADGEVVAPVCADLPELDFVNRVIGLRPEHAPLVAELVDHYRRAGVRPWFEVAPFDGVAALFDAFAAVGARSIGVHGMYAGRPKGIEPPPFADGVEVAPASDGPRFGALQAEGFEIEAASRDGAAAAIAAWLGEPGWHCYEATVDDAPVAVGTLAVDDHVGYLASAATVPSGRGRGAQSALIEARMAKAAQEGCDVVASLAAPSSSSARNMQRAGLAPACTLSTWRVI